MRQNEDSCYFFNQCIYYERFFISISFVDIPSLDDTDFDFESNKDFSRAFSQSPFKNAQVLLQV